MGKLKERCEQWLVSVTCMAFPHFVEQIAIENWAHKACSRFSNDKQCQHTIIMVGWYNS